MLTLEMSSKDLQANTIPCTSLDTMLMVSQLQRRESRELRRLLVLVNMITREPINTLDLGHLKSYSENQIIETHLLSPLRLKPWTHSHWSRRRRRHQQQRRPRRPQRNRVQHQWIRVYQVLSRAQHQLSKLQQDWDKVHQQSSRLQQL